MQGRDSRERGRSEGGWGCVYGSGLDGGGVDKIVESAGVTAHAPLNEHMGPSAVQRACSL